MGFANSHPAAPAKCSLPHCGRNAFAYNKFQRVLHKHLGALCPIHTDIFLCDLVTSALVSNNVLQEIWNDFIEEQDRLLQQGRYPAN